MKLCDHGCGQEAQFFAKSGKGRCAKSSNSCPGKRKRDSLKKKSKGGFGGRPSWTDPNFDRSKLGWNKGLTKETDQRVAKASKSLKTYCSKNPDLAGRAHTFEKEQQRRQKISASMKKNPNAGGYRVGSGRSKGAWYDSPFAGRVYLDSSFEIRIAKVLDKNRVIWKRNLIKFPYINENKEIRGYIPDFYLEDLDVYVEIKGYQTERDLCKWRDFPYRLIVLFEKDIKDLEEGLTKIGELAEW